MKIFFSTKEAFEDEYYVIAPEVNTFKKVGKKCSMGSKGGSYHVLLAHILGLHYDEYLRFIRDSFEGKIIGRKGYAYAVFPSYRKKDVDKFLEEVNRDLTLAFDVLKGDNNG